MKVYAVVAVWGNTKRNHAGMYYLACQLKKRFGKDFVLIPTPTKGSRFLYVFYRIYNLLIGLWLRLVVRKEDIVFLMEYLLSETEQADIAKMLKVRCNVRGIAHLVPHRLEKEYDRMQLLKRISYLDRLYVLGHSLQNYFMRKGISSSKVETTFHYVDTDFYHPILQKNSELTVICMGNMERDYEMLFQIIKGCEGIRFRICTGRKVFPEEFYTLENVEIFGFIEEKELLRLMQTSDVSLNVMKDTVGSNVITTSLACGLAVVASKVGSITDYVTDGVDGFLFSTPEECVQQLNCLSIERSRLAEMKRLAREKSLQISLGEFEKLFSKEFYGS